LNRPEPKYALKLRRQIGRMDDLFHQRAEQFFARYRKFIESRGQGIEFGVHCYLKLRTAMLRERIHFLRTGRYSSSSFAEVEQRVYSNPETMQTHMHGLLFAQFLWVDQYRRFCFFCDEFPAYGPAVRRYLEVGGGHALYITEAVRQLGAQAGFDLLDISASSMELAQGIARDLPIRYHLMNIFDYAPEQQYDFITMGEVIEHVEEPGEMLRKVRSLLSPSGRAYITTPANAPTIDHIYLFRAAGEIRAMLEDSGFAIEREVLMYEDDLPEERARELKAPLMYGAFVRAS